MVTRTAPARLHLLFITFIALCLTVTVAAQTQPLTTGDVAGRVRVHATSVGIGRVHQLDTYLSPQTYSGPQLQLMHETLRATSWGGGHVSLQMLWQADFASSENRASNARYLGGDLGYSFGWHYHWQPANAWRIMVGPQVGAYAGMLYNTRNGNNPAQAHVGLHLAASMAVVYSFHLWHQPLAVRYQLDVPLVGMKFSPNYGQSYYEIFSLGNYDHNLCATHLFNAFSTRHQLSIDVPLRRNTLRVGYLYDLRQSQLNQLNYKSYSHAFMLGVVRQLQIMSPRKHKSLITPVRGSMGSPSQLP